MQFLKHAVDLLLLLGWCGVTIWICAVGKKKNPNKGWNFIIASQVMYIIVFPIFFDFCSVKKVTYILTLLSPLIFLIIIGGGVIFLVGLYHIAQGKKRTSKKANEKRRVQWRGRRW